MKKALSMISITMAIIMCIALLSGCGKKCLAEGCENPPVEYSDYCEEHKCEVIGCYEGAITESKSCVNHKCIVPECNSTKKFGSDGAILSEYCENHGCTVKECGNARADDTALLCEDHMCSIDGCAKRRKDGSVYCIDHGCAKSGCGELTQNEYGLCKKHTCEVCGKAQVSESYNGKDVCYNCLQKMKANEPKQVPFTNKYGTPTTICAHSGCNNTIAPSGDTNCCTTHSRRCGNCNAYIDEDAMYCMSCITKTIKGY